MRAATSVFLFEGDTKFFGEGPYRLLLAVERTGSLHAAAGEMNLSYSKAIAMIRRAEEALGYPLTEKSIGGKGGGGSRLTPEARAFMDKYARFREACYEANSRIYMEIFS